MLNSPNFSLWYGEERPRWLGPIPYDYPAYLTGELPGDYGFDIAGLGKDPVAFQKYFKYVMCLLYFFENKLERKGRIRVLVKHTRRARRPHVFSMSISK